MALKLYAKAFDYGREVRIMLLDTDPDTGKEYWTDIVRRKHEYEPGKLTGVEIGRNVLTGNEDWRLCLTAKEARDWLAELSKAVAHLRE